MSFSEIQYIHDSEKEVPDMTTFTNNKSMASACLAERMIPANITVLVVSICVALLRVLQLAA